MDQEGRLDGSADTLSDRVRLVDNDIDFTQELIREGDMIVLPFPRNLKVRVTEVLSEHVILVNTSTWTDLGGTAVNEATGRFTPNDAYQLFPSGTRFEALGTFTGEAGSAGIKAGERNLTLKQGVYGFNFTKPNDVRAAPYDITIEEDWSGAAVVRKIKVSNAIGAAAIGKAAWGVVNYELVRKAGYARAEIDISAAGYESPDHVYLVRAGDGRYGKLRLYYEPNPDAPGQGQRRVSSVQYEIYEGI